MKHRKLLKRNKGKYWKDRQKIKATQQGSIKNR